MNQHLITALIDLAVVVFAFRKRGNSAARALAYTALGLGFWSIELYLLRVVSDLDSLNIWFHLTRWGMFFMPPCFALLAWRVLRSKSQLFLLWVVRPSFVYSICLSLSNFFLFPTELEVNEHGYFPKSDSIFLAFVFNFLWAILGSLFFLIKRYKSIGHRDRLKAKWMLITFVVVFLTGFIASVLAPYNFYYSNFVGSFLNVIFIALLFYSTIEHNLMELRLAISIGLTKVVLLGFSVWSLFYFSSLFKTVDTQDESGGMLSLVIFLIIILELYPRALNWMLSRTKKILVGDAYDYDKTKSKMKDDLSEAVDIRSFCSVFDYYLFKVVGVQSYSLLMLDQGQGNNFSGAHMSTSNREVGLLHKNDKLLDFCVDQTLVLADEVPSELKLRFSEHSALLCFCVSHESQPIALVVMGAPSHSVYYRYDDIRLFEWLQSELGLVLNRIRNLDEMQNQLGQAKKTLSLLGVMNHYHHDIKAPLAIIDGVLSNDIYDKEKQKDIVLQQVERGSQLITTMAGILKGERKRKVQPLSLSEVVKDSVFLFSQGIDEVNFLFGDVPEIKGDAEDLKILVINIIKNAIEARNEGQRLVVSISTWQTEDHVCLSFTDTGVGIPDDMVNSLWDEAVSSKSSGNGIGMQAIKRIADEHFAGVDVKSQLGAGTEFVFRFPNAIAVVRGGQSNSEKDDNQFKPDEINKPLAG